MAIKKVRERVHNGGTTDTEADWDIIHTETSEDMLVSQIQSLSKSGYRTLPGGLTLQWGLVDGISNAWKRITYPVSFKSTAVNIQMTEIGSTDGASQTYLDNRYHTNKQYFDARCETSKARSFYWFAVGY